MSDPMRILVTGGSGGLGRAVIPLARAAGHEIVSVDRRDPTTGNVDDAVTHRVVDVTDHGSLLAAAAGCDAIVHLAAHISPLDQPPHIVHNENVAAGFNVLDVADRLGIGRLCLASSVNAIGAAYSRRPRYDYFPLDERHPGYFEDPYALSKWVGEQQADAFVRLHETASVASLRLHALVDRRERSAPESDDLRLVRELWGYTPMALAARACLTSLDVEWVGHEVIYVVGEDTISSVPSRELAARHYPTVPVVGDLDGHHGFYDHAKRHKLLGF